MAQTTRDIGREPYWRMALARWRRSGLSVRAFCQAEGLGEPNFYWWRRKLEQADRQKPAFVPVQVVADPDPVAPPAAGGIEVVLANGRCLRVAPGFDPYTLVKLVALLEAEEAPC